jgi:hypothetical protein
MPKTFFLGSIDLLVRGREEKLNLRSAAREAARSP